MFLNKLRTKIKNDFTKFDDYLQLEPIRKINIFYDCSKRWSDFEACKIKLFKDIR